MDHGLIILILDLGNIMQRDGKHKKALKEKKKGKKLQRMIMTMNCISRALLW